MNRALLRCSVQLSKQSPLLALRGLRFQSTSPYKKKYYVDPEPQIGDYPNLPQEFYEDRPQRGWWDRQNRRNFGEPVPEQIEILNMWAPTQYWSPGWKMVGKMWCGFILTLGTVFFVISKARGERPYVRAFYPYGGLKEELGGVPSRTMAKSIEEAALEVKK